ncbi:UPF0223 family protein [Exiguobacterium sp. MER 193]|uniref:UPF0223 family protein n=1 Tax=Exiguobacterium sp. MER 193 TaxID=2939564 RepID=UPI00203FDD47|nr:UPF0223 family protein [Exiguobacterium sp. MER 193]MCM3279238.1 UPF0223 family protein [Exiguobacterium sp. MER 193]
MQINYPINPDWTTDELIEVVEFYNVVAQANEGGVEREVLLDSYRAFKQIVTSKSEEKQLNAVHDEQTGYSTYCTLQAAMKSSSKMIKL